MKRPFLVIVFIIMIIVGLAIGQVAVSNRLSTAGIELENLQNETAMYKKENTLIEEKILEASSLQNLSKKAKSIGFVPVRSQVYLTNPLPLALKSF